MDEWRAGREMDTFVSSLSGGDGGGGPTVERDTTSVLVVGRIWTKDLPKF